MRRESRKRLRLRLRKKRRRGWMCKVEHNPTTPKGNWCGITGGWRTSNLTDPHQIALVASIIINVKRTTGRTRGKFKGKRIRALDPEKLV
jgi:hypothetical protein